MSETGISGIDIHGPDIHFKGGKLIIPGYKEPVKGEVTVSDGLITDLSVDTELSANASRGYERIDISGRLLSPAFYDGHMHFREWSLMKSGVDLSAASSWSEVLDHLDRILNKRVHNELFSDIGLILGVNLDDTNFSEHDEPDRRILDAQFGDVPVLIKRVCGHRAYVNTTFLNSRDENGTAPEDGKLTDGSGIELSWDIGIDTPVLARCIQRGRDDLYKMGVIGGIEIISTSQLDQFFEAYEVAGSGLRLNLSIVVDRDHEDRIYNISRFEKDMMEELPLSDIYDMPGVAFSKIFADGSIGASSAAFDDPYVDGTVMDPIMNIGDLRRSFETADGMGLIPMVHAIGGKAVREVVKCAGEFEGIVRMEHVEDIDPDTLSKLVETDTVVCMQPNFVSRWGNPGGLYERKLGGKYSSLNQFRTIDRSGISWCFGTDMMPPGPCSAISGAVNHTNRGERLDFNRAVSGFSNLAVIGSLIGGKDHGSIKVGMPADLVVLNRYDVDLTLVSGRNPIPRS